MEIFLALGLAAVALGGGALYALWLRFRSKQRGELRVTRKKFITGNELDFYGRLLKACAGRYTVMAQVSMGALVDTALNPNHPVYWEVRRNFSSKIVDFVLCDPRSLAPLLIIELDDRMHDFDKDHIRDSFLAMAGFKSLRFWSRKKPDVEQLRAQILGALGLQQLPADA